MQQKPQAIGAITRGDSVSRLAWLAVLLVPSVGCSSDTTLIHGPAWELESEEAATARSLPSSLDPALPEHCKAATLPPQNLECTGLYSDVANKQTMPSIREYAPAVALWSDGASKRRWVSLPADTLIDNSDPDEWVFPIGTKFFKEFTQSGQRVETRMWQKVNSQFWVNATYQWDTDESQAIRTAGGDITLANNETYHIPTRDECDKCHRGRTERILGFETVLLGLQGAQGLDLAMLVEEELLSDPPSETHLELGGQDDRIEAEALSWLHVNCGISCHNSNTRSIAYGTGMSLRVQAGQLAGRSAEEFNAHTTTVGQPAKTANLREWLRVDPGQPASSLVYDLISRRDEGLQMPPFGSAVVDEQGRAQIERWILSLPPTPGAEDTAEATPSDSAQKP